MTTGSGSNNNDSNNADCGRMEFSTINATSYRLVFFVLLLLAIDDCQFLFVLFIRTAHSDIQ